MMKNAFLAKDTYYYEKLGLQKDIEIWEDGLRTSGNESSYEWWYFDAEYDNGYKVVVIFYTKNRFDVNGPSMPVATIDITLPNGSSITNIASEGNGPINASRDKCDVKICDSSIEYTNGDYYVHFLCSDLEYHCKLKPTFPMWRPETGHVFFGEKSKDFFAWLVAVPSAICEATLKVNNEIITMSGTGYHDHNWGNCSMKKVIDNWYWCRTNINNYTIIACDIIAKKKFNYSRVPLILIGKDGKIINDDTNNTILERFNSNIHPLTGKVIDNNLTLRRNIKNNSIIKIEFLRDHDLLATNLLDAFGLSKIKMILLTLLKKIPTYLRCIGMVQLTVNEDDKETIYEKEGIWEQMYFSSK